MNDDRQNPNRFNRTVKIINDGYEDMYMAFVAKNGREYRVPFETFIKDSEDTILPEGRTPFDHWVLEYDGIVELNAVWNFGNFEKKLSTAATTVDHGGSAKWHFSREDIYGNNLDNGSQGRSLWSDIITATDGAYVLAKVYNRKDTESYVWLLSESNPVKSNASTGATPYYDLEWDFKVIASNKIVSQTIENPSVAFMIGRSYDVVRNNTDTYTSVGKVKNIITLTRAEFNALVTRDPNTEYHIKCEGTPASVDPKVLNDLGDVYIPTEPSGSDIVLMWNDVEKRWEAQVFAGGTTLWWGSNALAPSDSNGDDGDTWVTSVGRLYEKVAGTWGAVKNPRLITETWYSMGGISDDAGVSIGVIDSNSTFGTAALLYHGNILQLLNMSNTYTTTPVNLGKDNQARPVAYINSASATTVNLPVVEASGSVGRNFRQTIKNIGTGTATIYPNSSDDVTTTIEGNASTTLATGETITLHYNASTNRWENIGGGGSGGSGLPNGGTTGQVLKKQSATDGDADWEDEITWGDDGRYIHLGKTTSQNVGGANGTIVDITWQTEIANPDSLFSFSGAVITVNFTGRVSVSGVLSAKSTGANRTTLRSGFKVNGGSINYRGAHRNYTRGSTYGGLSVEWDFEIDVTSGDTITLCTNVEDTDSTYTLNTQVSECDVVVRRIDEGVRGPKGEQGVAGQNGSFVYQGDWSAGSYVDNDVVLHNFKNWIVNVGVGSTTEEPSDTATDWSLFLEPDMTGIVNTQGSTDPIQNFHVMPETSWGGTTVAETIYFLYE